MQEGRVALLLRTSSLSPWSGARPTEEDTRRPRLRRPRFACLLSSPLFAASRVLSIAVCSFSAATAVRSPWGGGTRERERVAGRRKLGLLRPRPSALAKAAAAAKAEEGTGRVDCRKQFGGSAFLAKNQRSLLFSSSSRQGQTTLTFRAREAAAAAPTAAALQGCCCKDLDEG